MINTVHVALSCDDNYAPYAGVVIASALDSLDPAWNLECAVLHGGLSSVSIARLKGLANERLKIRFIDNSESRELEALPEMEHWTKAMYYRFLIADVFGSEVDRVIYLDCDLLIIRSLHYLYREDFNGTSMAVMENPGTHRLKALQIQKSGMYFNSGVLLINLAAWRKIGILPAVVAVAEQLRGRLVNPDQDILNVIFDGDVRFIDQRWNVQVSMYSKIQYDMQVLSKPWIVHFTTGLKPWNAADPHPFSRIYRSYVRMRKLDVPLSCITLVGLGKYPVRLFRRYILYYVRLCAMGSVPYRDVVRSREIF